MLPDEIVKILERYKNSNRQTFDDICCNMNKIIYNLNLFNESISLELQHLLSNHKINDTNQLYNDCIALCNYIDSIKPLQEQEKDFVEHVAKEETEEIIVPQVPNNILESIKLYLCEDNLCPECECNMNEVYTDYSQNINGAYIQNKVSFYKCECCGKYFIPDYDAVDIDITNTNLIFDTKYYNKITLFDDVYVTTNINYHSSKNHKLEDIDGKLNIILPNGEIITKIVCVTYCRFCKRYYMLKSTYDNLNGIPICSIIDETKVKQESTDTILFDSKGSKLTQYGYNVNCIEKLTDTQRRRILTIQLLSKNMQKNEIISILDTNIERAESLLKNKSKRDMSNALRKWRDDKNFVLNVILEECNKQIDIYRLILKYNKR